MKKLYDSWGPRLEDSLRNAVFAIVERGGNLLSVMQLLGEKPHREQIVPLIRDRILKLVLRKPLRRLRITASSIGTSCARFFTRSRFKAYKGFRPSSGTLATSQYLRNCESLPTAMMT